jgi:hypothetical protein
LQRPLFIFNLRRYLPYFYDTFWVKKITPVAELYVIPNTTWWSVALTHTIAWCMPTPPERAGVIPKPWAMPCTLGFGAILLGGE